MRKLEVCEATDTDINRVIVDAVDRRYIAITKASLSKLKIERLA